MKIENGTDKNGLNFQKAKRKAFTCFVLEIFDNRKAKYVQTFITETRRERGNIVLEKPKSTSIY